MSATMTTPSKALIDTTRDILTTITKDVFSRPGVTSDPYGWMTGPDAEGNLQLCLMAAITYHAADFSASYAQELVGDTFYRHHAAEYLREQGVTLDFEQIHALEMGYMNKGNRWISGPNQDFYDLGLELRQQHYRAL